MMINAGVSDADELLNIMRCKIMMLKSINIVRSLFVLYESQIAA